MLLLTWHDSSTLAKDSVCDYVTPRSMPQHDFSTHAKDESITPRCMPHGMLTPPTDESVITYTQLSGIQGLETYDHIELRRIFLTGFRSCTSRSHYRSVSKQTTRYFILIPVTIVILLHNFKSGYRNNSSSGVNIFRQSQVASIPVEALAFGDPSVKCPNSVMSDSDESGVTYTEVSSSFEELSDIRSPRDDDQEYLELSWMPEDPYIEAALQAPPSQKTAFPKQRARAATTFRQIKFQA
ncbi:hypothetical protein Tco_0405678 [Tanacetum coccineum]